MPETKSMDDQAMVAEIARRFEALAACDAEIIAFSGQGTSTHELITHDTRPSADDDSSHDPRRVERKCSGATPSFRAGLLFF